MEGHIFSFVVLHYTSLVETCFPGNDSYMTANKFNVNFPIIFSMFGENRLIVQLLHHFFLRLE